MMSILLKKISESEKDENTPKTPLDVPFGLIYFYNKFLKIPITSLTISIEDCNLFKKVRDNGKQVLLTLKSLRNQSWKDDNIE